MKIRFIILISYFKPFFYLLSNDIKKFFRSQVLKNLIRVLWECFSQNCKGISSISMLRSNFVTCKMRILVKLNSYKRFTSKPFLKRIKLLKSEFSNNITRRKWFKSLFNLLFYHKLEHIHTIYYLILSPHLKY